MVLLLLLLLVLLVLLPGDNGVVVTELLFDDATWNKGNIESVPGVENGNLMLEFEGESSDKVGDFDLNLTDEFVVLSDVVDSLLLDIKELSWNRSSKPLPLKGTGISPKNSSCSSSFGSTSELLLDNNLFRFVVI